VGLAGALATPKPSIFAKLIVQIFLQGVVLDAYAIVARSQVTVAHAFSILTSTIAV
jgi:hypothetical protein